MIWTDRVIDFYAILNAQPSKMLTYIVKSVKNVALLRTPIHIKYIQHIYIYIFI
jgi:hypothetical protein